MFKKHVHFADTNIVYSPPATPSPTFSELSLPSSGTPETPSTDQRAGSSLPATAFDPVCTTHVNPTIESTPTGPAIIYDLSLQPSFIRTCENLPLFPSVLSEAATAPHLDSLKLVSKYLPWTLVVVPIYSSPHPEDFVTVSDVLKALYTALRLAVTPAEYDALPSMEAKSRVVAAYENRCRKSGSESAYEEEKRKGVKRIDFLMGRNMFAGLVPISNSTQTDTWLLHVL